jgi:hypothetical protein
MTSFAVSSVSLTPNAFVLTIENDHIYLSSNFQAHLTMSECYLVH